MRTELYADQVVRPFTEACQKRKELLKTGKLLRNSAVVLDCFAGIGSGVVALKQLGIAIHKVIHVEQDLISSYVYRVNHDRSFVRTMAEHDVRNLGPNNGLAGLQAEGQLPVPVPPLDGSQIEHIYYDDFETMEKFIVTHGGTNKIIFEVPVFSHQISYLHHFFLQTLTLSWQALRMRR